MRINARPFTIVGVMPPSFRFPLTAPATQLWITLAEDARTTPGEDDAMTGERGALSTTGEPSPPASHGSHGRECCMRRTPGV